MVQDLAKDSTGKASFVLKRELTEQLEIGASIKIVGFALGKDGVTVTDTAIIDVAYPPQYSLLYENSHYILAEEGLRLEVVKQLASCPNPQRTITPLDREDWSLLSCKLYTVTREFISDLEKCTIDED